jgi:cytochrome c oxidase cbb3-type subunit 3
VCAIAPAAAWLASAGCRAESADAAQQAAARQPGIVAVAESLRFIAHAEYIPAGFPLSRAHLVLRNPHANNPAAVKTGAQLFIAYNCMDCHGADGSGAMAPSFQDGRYHFGGTDAEIFESIYQGRPEGMPAWGGRISDDQIWMLTSYLRSLGAGKDVSTENFTGKTVERSGH